MTSAPPFWYEDYRIYYNKEKKENEIEDINH